MVLGNSYSICLRGATNVKRRIRTLRFQDVVLIFASFHPNTRVLGPVNIIVLGPRALVFGYWSKFPIIRGPIFGFPL